MVIHSNLNDDWIRGVFFDKIGLNSWAMYSHIFTDAICCMWWSATYMVCSGLEYGQHDLHADPGPTSRKRGMFSNGKRTDILRRNGQHRQGGTCHYNSFSYILLIFTLFLFIINVVKSLLFGPMLLTIISQVIWYGGGNSTTVEEVSRFQRLFPSWLTPVYRKGIGSLNTCSNTHGLPDDNWSTRSRVNFCKVVKCHQRSTVHSAANFQP